MHDDLHILRLGYQDRVNMLPLLYPVAAGWDAPASPWRVEVVAGAPGELARKMAAGELDAAFLPPTVAMREGAGHGGQISGAVPLKPLGGWGLAVEGRSETALLLAPQRIDLTDGGHVAVSPEAQGATPEHLLRLMLTPYYGVELHLHVPGEPEYDPGGARLLYGDDAAKEAAGKPEGWVAEDLGVAWFVLTGLSTVWEMLAAPRDLEARKPGASEQLQSLLKGAQRTAQEQRASVLDVAIERLGLPRAQIEDLFRRQRYSLGEAEQKGLARFLDMAGRTGIGVRG